MAKKAKKMKARTKTKVSDLPAVMPADFSKRFCIKKTKYHPEINGTFKPMVGLDWVECWDKYREAVKKDSDVDLYKATIFTVAKSVVEWDVKDKTGKMIELTEDNLGRMSNMDIVKAVFSRVFVKDSKGTREQEKN